MGKLVAFQQHLGIPFRLPEDPHGQVIAGFFLLMVIIIAEEQGDGASQDQPADHSTALLVGISQSEVVQLMRQSIRQLAIVQAR